MANRLSLFRRGDIVIFHGFDGKDYTAHVERGVKRGAVKILYFPRADREPVITFVDDPSRIVGGQ